MKKMVKITEIQNNDLCKIISDQPIMSTTDDGDIVWENGDIPETYDDLLSDMEGVWLDLIAAWNARDINELKEYIDVLTIIASEQGRKVDDIVDFSSLPSAYDVPDGWSTYPIWSIDAGLNCLVGAAADEIEHVDNIYTRCSDPFQDGCIEEAVWHRDRTSEDRPDVPQYLCQHCYEAYTQDCVWTDEWEMI
jgi:hypothetical protein